MLRHSQITVTTCTDDDIPTCFEVFSESFAHDAPFEDIYYPNHDTRYGRTQGSKRFLNWKRQEENSFFLKAVIAQETQHEQVIGVAIWTHMTEPQPAELAGVEDDIGTIWPDDNDREFMRGLWKDYVVPQNQAIRKAGNQGIYVLELLAVHPGYQHRGAGSALVQWGIQRTDELGLKAVVESTPVGRCIYESCGFHTEIEEMMFNIDEKFKDRKIPKLTFLSREASYSDTSD